MSPLDLYHSLQLESLLMLGVRAEVPDDLRLRELESHAHVELQLTPSGVEGNAQYQFALRIRLLCTGTAAKVKVSSKLFEIELKAYAFYRQVALGQIPLEEFTANHTVFARQLFPALASRAQSLLDMLGLANIRIPLDLPPQPVQMEPPANVRLN